MDWTSLVDDAQQDSQTQLAREAAMLALAQMATRKLVHSAASLAHLLRMPHLQELYPSNILLICARFCLGKLQR